MMDIFCINLNIHYTAPQEVWDKIKKVYTEMPQWKGYIDGCPQWYGEEDKYIEASVEPSGLQLYAKLPQEEWDKWLQLFKAKLTEVLGYPIGEPEEGYDFKYWDIQE